MPSRIEEQRVECTGGLEVTKNDLYMSANSPGVASTLVNYEVSPSGGYARVLGYEKFNGDTHSEPGVGSCEGAVLGLFPYTDTDDIEHYYAIRKNTSGTTYSMWKYVSGGAWTSVTLPSTRNTVNGSTNINRVRWKQFNDGSTNWLILVDGVNEPLTFDGTTWREMTVGGTGSSSSQGGDQLIDFPNYIAVFKRHLFLARSNNGASAIVCHSAPNEPFNFTVADGAGQILPSYDIENIHPFRDALYVFGSNRIGSIEVSGSTFTYNDQVDGIGLVAPDTVHELGSSLIFLSQDGFRPIAGTDRIGDIEIAPVTEMVRPLLESIVSTYDKYSINTIVLNKKRQLRMSFGGTATGNEGTERGYMLSLRTNRDRSFQHESSELLGLTFWCGFSKVVNGREVTLHGGLDGIVYEQEMGNTFDGEAIFSSFSPPYLDQGSTIHRKSYKNIQFFTRFDYDVGSFSSNEFFISEKFDWDNTFISTPADLTYNLNEGTISYDSGVNYDSGATYGGAEATVIDVNLEGSAKSFKPGLVTTGITPKHIVFGFVISYIPEGVK